MNSMSRSKTTKEFVRRELKAQHQMFVDDEVLDTIDDVFDSERKSHTLDLVFYRALNVFFAIIFLIFFAIFKGSEYDEWMFVIMMAFFIVYNGIMGFNHMMDFKSQKKEFEPFNVGKK